MRAILTFELDRPAPAVKEILQRFGWDVKEPDSEETWVGLVGDLPPVHVFQAQKSALNLQRLVERELSRLEPNGIPDVESVRHAQHAATTAQEDAIEQERELLRASSQTGSDDANTEQRHETAGNATIQRLAANQARLILDQIAPDDSAVAELTFQFPIYDRRTLTWGTVHYEEDQPHVVIRLRNSHSERLKLSVQRLATHLVEGQQMAALTRLASVGSVFSGVGHRIWFRRPQRRSDPISFEHVKILEANSATEALSGEVVSQRTLGAVLRERRADLRVAAVFLVLSIAVMVAASPLIFDFDRSLHDRQTWNDGWLAWAAGNWSGLVPSLFVGALLPLVQVLLYWRQVRRLPVIRWSVD